MLKKTICVLFFLLPALAFAQHYKTCMWEVSHPKQAYKTYLFGTFHTTFEGAFDINDSIYWAIDHSKIFAGEISETDDNSRINSEYQDMYTLLENESFYEVFYKQKGKNIDSLVARFVRNQLQKKARANFRENSSTTRSFIIDEFLEYYARFKHKEIKPIETIAFQYKTLYSFSKEELKLLNERALSKNPLANTEISDEQNLRYYINKDFDSITYSTSLMQSDKAYKSFYKKLLDDRNIGMANYIMKEMKDKNITVAVGIGHMCGNMGMLAILKRKGYKIRPMDVKSNIKKRNIAWKAYNNNYFTTVVPSQIKNIVDINSSESNALNIGNNIVYPDGLLRFGYEFVNPAKASNQYDNYYSYSEKEFPEGRPGVFSKIKKSLNVVNKINFKSQTIEKTTEVEDSVATSATLAADKVATVADKTTIEKDTMTYPSPYVEFWIKYQRAMKNEYTNMYSSMYKASENNETSEPIRKPLGNGKYYEVYSGSDLVYCYTLPSNPNVKLYIRGDEKIMKRKEILRFFLEAKAN